MTLKDLRLKLLVLTGEAPADSRVLEALSEAFDVERVCDLASAHEALAAGGYDGLLSLPTALPRCGIEPAETLLEAVGEGICAVSPEGQLLWANPGLRRYSRTVLQRVLDCCRTSAGELADANGQAQTARHTLVQGDAVYEVVCTPVRDEAGTLVEIAAVVIDETASRRFQRKLQSLNESGAELLRLGGAGSEALSLADHLDFLERAVQRCARDLLHYDHFALYALDERTRRLEAIATMGLPEKVRDIEITAAETGQGITGHVGATGQSYLCPDTQIDTRYRPLGLPDARSSLCVPLRLQDKVIGVWSFESHRVNNFSQEDRQFAELLGHYVALALNMLRLLGLQRRCAADEITETVNAGLAGPLNDIHAEVTVLMDEFIGDGPMREHLQRVLDRTSQIRDLTKHLVEAPVTGLMPRQGADADPVLAGRRVLVADDEEIIRQTIQDVLQRYGAVVDIAADGVEAERLIGERQYDLVLSDIKMPHRTGYEVFAAAKAKSDAIPVILITGFGYDPNHSIVRANREGLSAVLFKPFKVDQLLDEVRSAIVG